MKKSHSHVTLSRNGSTTKLGNKSKSEKAQTKLDLRKKGTDDGPVPGVADFQVGDEEGENDDEWTEDSSSPYTTRQSSANPSRPKTPVTRDGEVDQPKKGISDQAPANLRKALLQAETNASDPSLRPQNHDLRRTLPYSGPPDAEAVTNRLLNRNGKMAPRTGTSNISASITPPLVSESPSVSQSNGSVSVKEPSMPADGISRFLDRSNADSGGGTPSSISHLQSTLDQSRKQNRRRTGFVEDDDFDKRSSDRKKDARRVRSAANLTHSRLDDGDSPPDAKDDRSPHRNGSPSHSTAARDSSQSGPAPTGPSPFESARAADPSAGKSLTQLRLDLQRREVQRSERAHPSGNHPLVGQSQGGMMSMVGLNGGEAEMVARVSRQWEHARREVLGVKRFWPDLVRSGVVERMERRGVLPPKSKSSKGGLEAQARVSNVKSKVGLAPSPAPAEEPSTTSVGSQQFEGRGRVRFEVGRSSIAAKSFESAPSEDGGDSDGGEVGAMENGDIVGLLRRMWMSGEVAGGD